MAMAVGMVAGSFLLGQTWPCGKVAYEAQAVQAARKEYSWSNMHGAGAFAVLTSNRHSQRVTGTLRGCERSMWRMWPEPPIHPSCLYLMGALPAS